LERIVNALNGKFEWQQVPGPDAARTQERKFKETPLLLRKLVKAWQLSGPDVTKFSFNHREMWADVARQFQTGMELNPLLLVGAPGGGAAFFMNSRPQPDPYKEALRLFIELLLNPECGRLAGPCGRCGNYYVRRSAKNKLYCSRSCGTRATALAATKKKREEEHGDKLRRAAEAAQEWTTARTRLDWKQWVSRSCKEPPITPKFLTRAVNKGELQSPTKEEEL